MFQEKICACCGKKIVRPSFSDYIYRLGNKFYCGWNCYYKCTQQKVSQEELKRSKELQNG